MDDVQRITDDTTLEESGGNYESLYHCLRCKNEINAVQVVHRNHVANQGAAQEYFDIPQWRCGQQRKLKLGFGALSP